MIFQYNEGFKKTVMEVKEVELYNSGMLFVNNHLIEAGDSVFTKNVVERAYYQIRKAWIEGIPYICYDDLRGKIVNQLIKEVEEEKEIEAENE